MFGLIISVIYAAILHFVKGASNISAYLSATNFLFWWYVVTSSILGVILLATTFILSSVAAKAGEAVGEEEAGSKGKTIGALAGLFIGGGFSILMFAIASVRCGALIAGSWMLHNAVNMGGEWDNNNLIWGGILLVVGLLMSTGNKITPGKNQKED